MKSISALLLASCFALTAYGQRLILNGSLKTGEKAPVPATHISIHGIENTTDSKGLFKIVLPGDFSEGERVIIKVVKPNWVINYPLDGEWNLPNIKLQNIQTLNVIIVPKGSKSLWTNARIEKHIAKLSDEIARLKKEGDTPRSIDFSFYMREWADQYGFTPEQVKAAFDDWAKAVEKSDDHRTLGLRAFYQNNFLIAAENFVKAAQKDEEQIKQIDEQRDKKTLDAYQNRKDAANSFKNLYQFKEALEQYVIAKLRLAELRSKNMHQHEYTEVEVLIGGAKRELGIRVKGEEGNRLLSEAVDSYKKAFAIFTREEFPQDWAMTQNNLGGVLLSQGERMAGNQGLILLAEAEAAFRNALQVRTHEQLPQEWAITQNNLGLVLWSRGQRLAGEEGVKLLAEAINAYRNTLLVHTREQLPQQWAGTQNNLGNALWSQGNRVAGKEGVKLLADAVDAYHGALLVFTRERLPQQWAMTQDNLGITLWSQGQRVAGEEGVKLLAEAVAAYRNALLVQTRENLPQQWAGTQDNLGLALWSQGARMVGDEGVQLLNEAVAAFRNALQIRTREELPQGWAMTQNNMGIALSILGNRVVGEQSVKLLDEAVAAYHSALLIHTREQMPQQWAMTQSNMGGALLAQGERMAGEEGIRLLAEAVAAFHNALQVRTREQMPQQWAATQGNLGRALQSQGQRTGGDQGGKLLAEAVAAHHNALLVHTREQLPQYWVKTQNDLGDTYYLWGRWDKAAECYANVLTLYPGEKKTYQRLSEIYQEKLFEYELAFNLHRNWLTKFPDDLFATADFAETNFITERFAECEKRIAALLGDPKVDVNTTSALRAIDIANSLALGQVDQVPAKLDTIIRIIVNQPAEFKLTWGFGGSLHFIEQSEKLMPYRQWLRQIFNAMQAKNRDAIVIGLREARAGFKR